MSELVWILDIPGYVPQEFDTAELAMSAAENTLNERYGAREPIGWCQYAFKKHYYAGLTRRLTELIHIEGLPR